MVIKVITYIVMAASMVGTIANSCKKRWCFYIWLCTNAFWFVYNFSIGQTAQGLLYTFHFSMAILGVYQWKHNKTDTENINETIRDGFIEGMKQCANEGHSNRNI